MLSVSATIEYRNQSNDSKEYIQHFKTLRQEKEILDIEFGNLDKDDFFIKIIYRDGIQLLATFG